MIHKWGKKIFWGCLCVLDLGIECLSSEKLIFWTEQPGVGHLPRGDESLLAPNGKHS